MAQHYKVDINKADNKIKKSLTRICNYLARGYVGDKFPIYTKEVCFLPDEYNNNSIANEKAITIKPYNLNPSFWGENANNATLEVHFNYKTGEIYQVYCPL